MSWSVYFNHIFNKYIIKIKTIENNTIISILKKLKKFKNVIIFLNALLYILDI